VVERGWLNLDLLEAMNSSLLKGKVMAVYIWSHTKTGVSETEKLTQWEEVNVKPYDYSNEHHTKHTVGLDWLIMKAAWDGLSSCYAQADLSHKIWPNMPSYKNSSKGVQKPYWPHTSYRD